MFDTCNRADLQIAFGEHDYSRIEKVAACWDFFYSPNTGICVSSFSEEVVLALPLPLYVGAMFLKYVLCLLGSLPCLFLMLLSFGVHSQPPGDQIKLFEILKCVSSFQIVPFYVFVLYWILLGIVVPVFFLAPFYLIIACNVLVGCILVMDIWNNEQDSFTDRVESLLCLVFGEDFGYACDDDAAKGILDCLLIPGVFYNQRRLICNAWEYPFFFRLLILPGELIRLLLGSGIFLAALPLMSLSYGVTLGKNALREFLCPSFSLHPETLFRQNLFRRGSDDDLAVRVPRPSHSTRTIFDSGSTDDLRQSDVSSSADQNDANSATKDSLPCYDEAVQQPPSYDQLYGRGYSPPPYGA